VAAACFPADFSLIVFFDAAGATCKIYTFTIYHSLFASESIEQIKMNNRICYMQDAVCTNENN